VKLLTRARAWALLAGSLCVTAVMAGGHYAVDDAAILEPGNCQVETWLTRADDRGRLLHAGTGCRVGPLELGVAAEHERLADARDTGYGLHAKWATELLPAFSAGLSLSAGWQAHAQPRYQGSALSGLFSWSPRDDLALHLNLGRDFVRGDSDLDRSGASVVWTARPGWSLIGERYLEARTHFVRVATRWVVSDAWSLDFSRAHRLHGPGESSWTIGATWQFARP
jgi:hypothetical protein